MTQTKSVGIFWDYENVPVWVEGAHVPLAERILDVLRSKGYFRILNVYGKWDPNDSVLKGLYSLGFKAISVPMSQKNSADIKLTVDCIASCYESNLDTIVIISADKDFIPVITHLRSIGKEVIVVAPKQQSGKYISISPNEFIYLESLLKKHERKKLNYAVNSYVYSLTKRWKSKRSKTMKREPTKTYHTFSFDEIIKEFNQIITDFQSIGKVLDLPAIEKELCNRTKNEFPSFQSIATQKGFPVNNFRDLVQVLVSGREDVILENNEIIRSSSKHPVEESESPLISEWSNFVDEIQYFLKNHSQLNIFSRIRLTVFLQRNMEEKMNIVLEKSEINEKIEFLVNVGLLIEDQDLNFKLAPAFKVKRETFLKSFLTPTKQSSLLDTLN